MGGPTQSGLILAQNQNINHTASPLSETGFTLFSSAANALGEGREPRTAGGRDSTSPGFKQCAWVAGAIVTEMSPKCYRKRQVKVPGMRDDTYQCLSHSRSESAPQQ